MPHKPNTVKTNDEQFSVTIDATEFRVANDLEALLENIAAENRGGLRFVTAEYPKVIEFLLRELEKSYGGDSRQFKDVLPAALYCTGCMWEYPESYRLNLRLKGNLQKYYQASIGGALPGYKQFGEQGICVLCESKESLLVYECYPPESISEKDISAIRRYFHEEAEKWWGQQKESSVSCTGCKAMISRNQGFVFQRHLICTNCLDIELENGVELLKGYPHQFGNNLLRRIRGFRR
ncbi:MAG TPA: hypothetical protein VFQ13_11695 [Anaerolineales bacterium]|nr:hypothetical protein [Anaerolineales bacterium]